MDAQTLSDLVKVGEAFLFRRPHWDKLAAEVAPRQRTDEVVETATSSLLGTCVLGALAVLAYLTPTPAGIDFASRYISPGRPCPPDSTAAMREWLAARVIARWAKKSKEARRVFERALLGRNGELAEAVVDHYDAPYELVGQTGKMKSAKGIIAVLAITSNNYAHINPYTPADVSQVASFLDDCNEELRGAAAFWLRVFATPQNASHVLPVLQKAQAKERSEGIRRLLAKAIQAAGG